VTCLRELIASARFGYCFEYVKIEMCYFGEKWMN